MTAIVEAQGLTKRFGKVTAVNDVTFTLDEGAIHGLLGRNGAGKTTLMHVMTGQDFATEGHVRIFGESPVENAAVLGRTCFIKESQVYPDDFRGKHVLRAARWFYPHWNDALAQRLVDTFQAPLDRKMKKMSRGQRSAVGVIVALASRAELTFLDEPYAGLDAVARKHFYDLLLEDYLEHPRTFVLSTHLIDEAAPLLQRVLVIDKGELVIDADADSLRATATTLVGKASDVERFAAGREVLDRTAIGAIASVTLTGLSEQDKREAASAGLETTPVSLQELIVRRTGGAVTEEVSA
ncbi:ABC transporter ATP-binding protein [Demequina sp. B12]|uniref:ABC transporter ATP-binding protein n=1 Tax=Demequina sp. B12 TaxID=2992757 RepID=UPI00237B2427|nr:ABC transporter ATP-binding protein [Demequina sp. B12]MDE0573540.1 ABC transporter ATP-binding protein [Demequina sp. B12]